MPSQLDRLQKIYDMRVQGAKRALGDVRASRMALEREQDQLRALLTHEVDACDSLETAPFDFAVRFYRATIDRIEEVAAQIAQVQAREVELLEKLREKYKEEKEFGIYAARKRQAAQDKRRLKENEAARSFQDHAPQGGGMASGIRLSGGA